MSKVDFGIGGVIVGLILWSAYLAGKEKGQAGAAGKSTPAKPPAKKPKPWGSFEVPDTVISWIFLIGFVLFVVYFMR
jgi:hypothetical protein